MAVYDSNNLLENLRTFLTLGSPGKIYNTPGSFPKADFRKWVGHKIPVYGISYESPTDVWIQISGEETNNLLDLVAEVSGKGLTGPSGELKIGAAVLALYPEDQSWYRARIIRKISPSQYRVFFVDYGNEEIATIDNLRDCPATLLDYVEGVTCCALTDFTDNEPKEVLAMLPSVFTEQDVIAQIDFVSYEINGKTRLMLSVFDKNGTPLKKFIHEHLNSQSIGTLSPEDAVDSTAVAPKLPKVIKVGSTVLPNSTVKSGGVPFTIPSAASTPAVKISPSLVNPSVNNALKDGQQQLQKQQQQPDKVAALELKLVERTEDVEHLRSVLQQRDSAVRNLTLGFASLSESYMKEIAQLKKENENLNETVRKLDRQRL